MTNDERSPKPECRVRSAGRFFVIRHSCFVISIPISLGIVDVPRPGAFDDFFDGLVLRLPAELALDFFRGGDELRRVAGTARFLDRGDRLAGDLFAGGDDFADAGAAAGAEVVKGAFRDAQGEDVRLREVDDVDVIA